MNLNGKVTNPGEMRTWVGLGSRSNTTDAGGAQKPAFTQITEVWAKWENVHGPSIWAANAETLQRRATVTIRYNDQVDETWGVKLDGAWWEILSIDNIRNRSEYVELVVQQVRSG